MTAVSGGAGGSALALTREWTALHDDELRRRAVRAAGARDVAALVSLTTAYLSHAGGSGVLTSPHTGAAYQRGGPAVRGVGDGSEPPAAWSA